MNVLFLSLIPIADINYHGIYSDLLREFHRHGHKISIVYPNERRNGKSTAIVKKYGVSYLSVWTLNIQKTNRIEKGISTLLIESQFKFAIKRYLSDIKFDLILYATPPITFANVVDYVRKRDGAKSYLLLKDIFPQNAIDLGLFRESGILHKYFRNKEKKLYKISDAIGCMSDANVKYLLKHNTQIPSDKVEVCPNSMEICDTENLTDKEKSDIRKKFGLPLDKKIFVYGGNLGKPQNIQFIIDCLKVERTNSNHYYVIVGSGTEFHLIKDYVNMCHPDNTLLHSHMPKEEYDQLVKCCDAGLIFLDNRFTIPNYPSRLLSYLSAGIPIIASTDPNTDIGNFIEENGIGVWCESSSCENFQNAIEKFDKLKISSDKIHKVLCDNYDVRDSYKTIVSRFE